MKPNNILLFTVLYQNIVQYIFNTTVVLITSCQKKLLQLKAFILQS